jgi:hypothetical protein
MCKAHPVVFYIYSTILDGILTAIGPNAGIIRWSNKGFIMESQTILALKPSRLWYIRSILWKYFLASIAPFLLATAIQLLTNANPSTINIFLNGFLPTSFIVFLYLVFGTMGRARFSITLSDGIIEGPSVKDNDQRIRFPVTHLDLIPTRERSFWNKVIGLRILYSVDGEKILLNKAVFPPAQVRALLQELNVTQD